MTYRCVPLSLLSTFAAAVTALPTEAATVPADEFIISRERTATAIYVVAAPDGTVTTILEDTDTFNAAGFVGAEVRTSVGDLGSTRGRGTPGTAKSDMNVLGLSSVFIDGIVNSSTFGSQRLSAEVSETITGRVPSVSGRIDVNYSFELSDMFVEIWDDSTNGVGDSGFDAIFGRVWYEILLNDVTTYQMSATVAGGRLLPDLGISTGIFSVDPDVANTDVTVIPDGSGPGDIPRGVKFDDIFERNLFVGTFFGADPSVSEEFKVKVTMGAELFLPAFELDVGGRVTIGDPNTLAFGFDDLTLDIPDDGPSVIPLPASMWLMLGAISALFGLRRRNA